VRLYVAIIIAGLAIIAFAVGNAAKPIVPPIKIDAQSPGVWPKYASVPQMPGAMICRPILYPRHPLPSDIVRT
jgi:hypothetical protein